MQPPYPLGLRVETAVSVPSKGVAEIVGHLLVKGFLQEGKDPFYPRGELGSAYNLVI